MKDQNRFPGRLAAVLPCVALSLTLLACKTPAPAPAPPPAPAAPNAAPPARLDAEAALAKAVNTPLTPLPGTGWQTMFDGRTLAGWRETEFAGKGGVEIKDGVMVLNRGNDLTGVNWTNPSPTMNYELALEGSRIMGSDFFCGLTFPVRTNSCTLVVGGWGGGLVGISSLSGMDASENETTRVFGFETGRWYRLRVRVIPGRIQVWLDDDRIINAEIGDRTVGMRAGEIELAAPLGISSYATTAAIRGVSFREIVPDGSAR